MNKPLDRQPDGRDDQRRSTRRSLARSSAAKCWHGPPTWPLPFCSQLVRWWSCCGCRARAP